MNRNHKLWAPALLSLALAAALPGCSTEPGHAAAGGKAAYQLMQLSQGTQVSLSGKIIPDQEVKVVSKGSGKVAAVSVEEGAAVHKGDVLVQLETDDLLTQVRQAESGMVGAQAKLADLQAGARPQEIAALESAVAAAKAAQEQAGAVVQQSKAGFDLATSSYNRLRNLYDSSASVSKEDLDKGTFEYEKARTAYEQTQAAYKAAGAQVEAAQAKLDLARSGATDNTLKATQAEVTRLSATLDLANSSLNNAAVTAPVDGIVVKRNIQPGEMAQAGTALLSVVKMDRVQVEVSAADNQIAKIKTGAEVEVKVPTAGDQPFKGTVTFVSPVATPNTSSFPVKVTVDNQEGKLFAGMVAEVVTSSGTQQKLEVPKSAVLQREGKAFVAVADSNGKAKLVEVQAEEKNAEWVYVQESDQLKAGQSIVMNPDAALADGTALKAE
ncbi:MULTISPECIES: efflux RND transporter periplasmic adaptor subunit [Paenibacillus]|uniref:efflux RND transporter periplasmic adaptor subunit n=1 Tax=Paenibacillus TaxID=44249 RepID=UPI0022B8A7EE|nr:efflux RND transporter periplasmic adaptor subunit [Paenibacillus caseinilyticus]MCZ8522892.1 efflux RND transporter periplasmic adaptor subunit [Paenibacillus caseinilyticus]